MKLLIPVITIAALPLLSSSICQAQDDGAGQAADEARRARESAQQALDHAQKQVEQARMEVEHATRTAPGAPGAPVPPNAVFTDRLQNIIRKSTGGSMSTPARPLVIRSSGMEPRDQASLEEDLAVMTRVLDKAAHDTPAPGSPFRAMGIDVFSAGSAPMRDMYLEGYGAVFMLRVGMPLLPPPPPPAEQTKEESQTDSAWEQAKQELYGGPGDLSHGPVEEFSEGKVNDLRTRLLEALKSASNIRQLKPDESVTVCVFGGATPGRVRVGGRGLAKANGGPTPPQHASWAIAESGGGAQQTVMTIRVKKSDIDAFAKGKLDADQFRKHARIEVYPAAGPGGPAVFGASTGGVFGGGGLGGGGGGQY